MRYDELDELQLDAIKEVANIEIIYIRPQIRQFLEENSAR